MALVCTWLATPALATPPANDSFATATVVAGDEVDAGGSSAGATLETDEPEHAGNPGGASVWFSWTPDTSGPVLVDTLVSHFDTLLAVYTGPDLASLSLVAESDDAGTRLSRVEFDAVAGTTYRIALDGYEGAAGSYRLRITRNLIRVPADHATVQGALDAATSGATILVSPGLYREHVTLPNTPVVLASEHGPYVTTLMAPAGSSETTLRIFSSGADTRVSGFTIAHDAFAEGDTGRGVRLQSSSAILAGNVIRDNREPDAAGMTVPSGAPLIIDNRIIHNDARRLLPYGLLGRGGALGISGGTPTLIGNEISNNRADRVSAIAISGFGTDPLLEDNLITGNEQTTTSPFGGGYVVDIVSGAGATLRQNVIADNEVLPGAPLGTSAAVVTSIGATAFEGNLIEGHEQASFALTLIAPDQSTVFNNIFTQPSAPTLGVVACDDNVVPGGFAHNLFDGNVAGDDCAPLQESNGNIVGEPELDPVDGLHPLDTETSLVVDAGDGSLGTEPGVDFDGNERVTDGTDEDLIATRDIGPFETQPGGVIQFSRAAYDARNDAASVDIEVRRLGGSTGQASVRLTSVDGTLAAGAGYAGIDQTVTFADGDAIPQVITIPLTASNPGVEDDDDFRLVLSEASGASLGRWYKAAVQVIGDRFDVAIEGSVPAGDRPTGADITASFTVTNQGNTAAPEVTVTVPVSAGTTAVGATHDGNDCGVDASGITCAIGDLEPGTEVAIAVTVQETLGGTRELTAEVTTPGADLEPGNDTATVEYTVVQGFRLLDYYPTPDGGNRINVYRSSGNNKDYVERLGTARINGVDVFTSTIDRDAVFFTNDDDGLRFHRLDFRDVDLGLVKVTFEPPMTVGPAVVIAGGVYGSTGSVRMAIPGIGRVPLNYAVSSSVDGMETVTVQGVTYDALKITTTLTISGTVRGEFINETGTLVTWLAQGIGAVKTVSSLGGTTETDELVGHTPDLITPTPGSTLSASSQQFIWTLNNIPADRARLRVGTRAGRNDLFDSGNLPPETTTAFVPALPADGTPVFVRLSFRVKRVTYSIDWSLQAADFPFPAITSPLDSSTLTESAATFAISTNGHAVERYCLTIGSRAGRTDIHDEGCRIPGDTESLRVENLYADGRDLFVRLRARILGRWHNADYQFQAADFPFPAITSPANASALTESAVTFDVVDNGHAVERYCVYVGSRAGRSDYHASGCRIPGDVSSYSVDSLHADGRDLFVRLRARIRGRWYNADYRFQAADLPFPAITSPADASTLTASEVTFDIADNGQAVERYCILVGSRAGRDNYHNSGCRVPGDVSSYTIDAMHADGRDLFVRLRARIMGRWFNADYRFQAADFPFPAITSPADASTLTASQVTFDIADNGQAVDRYCVRIGSRAGRDDYHDSGCRVPGDVSSYTVDAMHADGRDLFVRLRARILGRWYTADYRFTAADLPFPAITSPGNASTLTQSSVTFDIDGNGQAVERYCVYVGNRAGQSNYHDSGCRVPGDVPGYTVEAIHADGRDLFVRLRARIMGRWYNTDYQYTAATLPFPEITAPAGGSTLPGAAPTFDITSNGHAVERYCLYAGNRRGRTNYFSSGCRLPADTMAVETDGLPVDGRDVFVRLRARILGRWYNHDLQYQAGPAP